MTLLGGGAHLTGMATGNLAGLIAVAATCVTSWAISPSFAQIGDAEMEGELGGGVLTGVGEALSASGVDSSGT